MVKSHKCSACGRAFGSAKALSQHSVDSHGAKKKRSKSKRSSAGQGAAPMGGATLFEPVAVRQTVEDDRSTHRGVDRVAHVADVSKFADGAVVCRVPVNAGTFSRLSALAETYQQVRFMTLSFRVTPYANANCGGGYVAAFVRDPDDEPPSTPTARLNWLSSQAGSISTRWSQQSSVRAMASDRWFYTSPGVEGREYSPGTLYVVADSKATAASGMTIWATWTVSFRKATLESHPLKGLTAAQNLYTQNGHIGLFGKDGTTWVDDNDKLFPGWSLNKSLRLPYPITLPVTTAESTTTSRVVWWIKFTSKNDAKFCYEDPNSASDEKASAEVLVLPQGTFLEFAGDNDDLQGEAQGPPPSSSKERGLNCCEASNLGSTSSERLILTLVNTLASLQSSLTDVCRNLQTSQLVPGGSDLMGSFSLTGSQQRSVENSTIRPLQSPPPEDWVQLNNPRSLDGGHQSPS